MTDRDREKAFEEWWSFPVSRPDVRKSLAREAYYSAWDDATLNGRKIDDAWNELMNRRDVEIEQLRAKNRELASTLATYLLKLETTEDKQ